jgi:hypothetical protein
MEEWTWHDRGIWTAEKVAGGEMGFEGRVCASNWLKRIGGRSLLKKRPKKPKFLKFFLRSNVHQFKNEFKIVDKRG